VNLEKMELSLLSEVFQQPIRTFPGSRPLPEVDPGMNPLHNGYVMSYTTLGDRALLFMSPTGAWLWNISTNLPIPLSHLPTDLYIFEVEVTPGEIYISDVLVYANRVVISRDYLERLETARKWSDAYRGNKQLLSSDTTACRSAYGEYVIGAGVHTIRIRRIYPAFQIEGFWKRRTREVQGLVFHRLLVRYEPFCSSGLLEWQPGRKKASVKKEHPSL